ncbi:MAG TPA: ABC transporter permease, partial [Solibacterales bacterium]|nr:ABC transporter permease [Bryobacterales bacterium]
MLLQHFRFGLRQLRGNPGFAVTAVLSLALGIAANTSIFTLVDQVLLRLLPVSNPRELVQLRMEGGRTGSQNGDGLHTFSYPLYTALRDSTTVFSGVTGQFPDRLTIIAEERGEVVDAVWAAGNFFDVLGVKAHVGRVFNAGDDEPGRANPVVVLQYDFWQSRYGGRPEIVGSTVRLNGAPFTIIGVAAPEFSGTNAGLLTQLWVPLQSRTALAADHREDMTNERFAWFYLMARLKPGVTREQAQAGLAVFYEQRKKEELKAPFFAKFPDTR